MTTAKECGINDPGYMANWGLNEEGYVIYTGKLNKLVIAAITFVIVWLILYGLWIRWLFGGT